MGTSSGREGAEPVPSSVREIHLAARPEGEPVPTDFRLVEGELPDLGPGELLVRNLVMSVDPYMRGRMNDTLSYAPPWQLDQPARGGAVGRVLASEAAELAVGDLVLHDPSAVSTGNCRFARRSCTDWTTR
jgi:NADPH-dependent curcumin reductase CurA